MRRIRKFSLAACGLLLFSTSFAQTSPPPAPQPAPTPQAQRPTTPAAPPMPPDRAAYMAASAIKDPTKKIEAMEKFVADFPDSSGVPTAHQTLLNTLVQKFPEQKDRISAQVDKIIATTPDFSKSFTYSSVATTLIEANILLEKAEELATKGLALTEE